MAVLLAFCSSALAATITVTPSTTYQTWHWSMGGGGAYNGALQAQPGCLAGSPCMQQMNSQSAGQLGLNTMQLVAQPGFIEQATNYFAQYIAGTCNTCLNAYRYAPVNDNADPNTFACAPGCHAFPMDELFFEVDGAYFGANQFRDAVIAAGNTPHLVFTWIDWPTSSNFLDSNPAEAAEHILAAFTWMQATYGAAPDVIDIQLEPDGQHTPVWTPTTLGNALKAVHARLSAAGFNPTYWCCAVENAGNAVSWYNTVNAIAPGVIGAISWHPYAGYSASTAAAIARAASSAGICNVMSEWTIAGFKDLFDFVENANACGFNKYGWVTGSNANNSSYEYLSVSSYSPYTAAYTNSGTDREPSWFFPQFFHYVQDGCVREAASSDNGSFDPVAFRCPGNLDKVVVRLDSVSGSQTVNVTGVAAGTYGCTYTYNNANLLASCGTKTINAGGTLTASLTGIPSPTHGATTAAVTFYAMQPANTPVVFTNGVVPLYSAAPVIQPGSWISIYGSQLATQSAIWNNDFATKLAGVTVKIDNKPGYLLSVSPGQINLQAPDDTFTGPVNVVVSTPNGTATSSVTLAPYGPSLSVLGGTPYAAAEIVTVDGSGAYGNGTYDILGPTGAFPFNTRPVKPGEVLELFGVGFGPTKPAVPAGAFYAGSAPTTSQVSVTIGGKPAAVSFSGITFAGGYQINVAVPPDIGSGNQQVLASVGGMTTPTGVLVPVQ